MKRISLRKPPVTEVYLMAVHFFEALWWYAGMKLRRPASSHNKVIQDDLHIQTMLPLCTLNCKGMFL